MDKKEIRDILLGRIVRQDEEFWAAAPAGTKFHFHGIKDGAGDVRLFGVTHLLRCYHAAGMEPSAAFEALERALYSMGRPLRLAAVPKGKACLYAPGWIAPVVMVGELDGGSLWLMAHTGHSLLFGQIRCRIALWILEQRLPEGIIRTGKSKKLHRPTKMKKAALPAKSTVSKKKNKPAPKRLKK